MLEDVTEFKYSDSFQVIILLLILCPHIPTQPLKKSSSLLTGKEHSLHRAWNLSFSTAGLIQLCMKDVNSKVTCGPQNHTHKHRIILTCPPPYFCTNHHFTKLPTYNFVFPLVVLIRILKTFRKSDVLIIFTLSLGYNFIFNPNYSNNVWDCRFSKRWRFTLLSSKLQMTFLKTQAKNLNPTIRNSITTKCLTQMNNHKSYCNYKY